jgi:hypothetical protein
MRRSECGASIEPAAFRSTVGRQSHLTQPSSHLMRRTLVQARRSWCATTPATLRSRAEHLDGPLRPGRADRGVPAIDCSGVGRTVARVIGADDVTRFWPNGRSAVAAGPRPELRVRDGSGTAPLTPGCRHRDPGPRTELEDKLTSMICRPEGRTSTRSWSSCSRRRPTSRRVRSAADRWITRSSV